MGFLSSFFSPDRLINLLLTIPCVLLALTFHEFAHGWVAKKLGDDTASNFGRLTLNPLKHLDPIGTICMIFFNFGWAKPVPINTRKFKNPRTGMALTAAAGPLMNLLLAFVSAFLFQLVSFIFYRFVPPMSEFAFTLQSLTLSLIFTFHYLNLYLGIFNLIIPIPPFDGSRIVFLFLPTRLYFGIMKYEKYLLLGLLVLFWTGVIRLPISSLAEIVSNGMLKLAELIIPV